MPLEDILASLDDAGRETVLSAIEAEKQRGIKAKQTASSEAIKAKDKLKSLGYNPEEHETFEAFKSLIDKKVFKADATEVTLASLNEKLNDVSSKLTATEEKAADKTRKLAEQAITKKLSAEIGGKLYAADLIVKANASKFTYDEDTDSVAPVSGTFAENVASILEENKENLKVEQISGNNVKPVKASPSGEKDFADRLAERMNK